MSEVTLLELTPQLLRELDLGIAREPGCRFGAGIAAGRLTLEHGGFSYAYRMPARKCPAKTNHGVDALGMERSTGSAPCQLLRHWGHGGRASPLCMTTAAPPDSVPVCLAVERRLGPHNGIQCTLTDSSFTRVSVAIQFTSQVLPPSSENACSKRHESGVMSDQTFRTRMVLPLNDS